MSRRPNSSVQLFKPSFKLRLLSSDSAPYVGPQPLQTQPSLFTKPSSPTHTENPRRRSQLLTKLEASPSSHRFSPLQSSNMNGWDANWVWAQDPGWGNAAGQGTWNQGNQTNGTFFNPSAPPFAPLGPNASGYGSYGLAEIQRAEMERANQRAHVTKAHAAARERASTDVTPTLAQEEPAGYVQQRQGPTQEQGGWHVGEQEPADHHISRRDRRHQRHHDAQQQQSIQQLQQFIQQPEQFGLQDHFTSQQSNLIQQLLIQQQQQFLLQQQVHQGPFHPTAPNFFNNTQPGFHTNITVQEQQDPSFGLPTPPRTNSPSSRKQLPNPNPKPPAKGGKRRPKPPPPTGPKAQAKLIADRDAIIPPSPASGGIPTPSEVYLLRASLLPRTLPQPQPLLAIIDLNGTLLYRPNSHKAPRHFVLRPGAAEFLSFCLSSPTFKVMIWSSARPANVAAMLDKLPLSQSQRSDLVAVWGRDKFGLSSEDYTRRVQCYKRLSRVWADPLVKSSYPHGYNDRGFWVPEEERNGTTTTPTAGEEEAAGGGGGGWAKGGWSQGNTVLIDDSREKARSEPYNAVEIPEFRGDMTEDVLPRVRGYLEGLARQADVSTFMRVCPFKPVEEGK